MDRWPGPADLAAAPTADVLREWAGLGYPRRALRLRETAQVVTAAHGGRLPESEDALRGLPGVGAYTAAAVAAFAFGARTPVLDTNVRRVLARALRGAAGPPGPHLRRDETAWAASLLPADSAASVAWNAGLMELGALVCTARSPRCEECPLRAGCRWLREGRPAADVPARRPQAWHGTDRQLRGAFLGALTSGPAPLTREALVRRSAADLELGDAQQQALVASYDLEADTARRTRILDGLAADGLVEITPEGWVRLPG